MKDLVSIASLPSDRVSDELLLELATIYPDGRRGKTFGFHELLRSDPRVEQIVSVLRKYDWYPKLDLSLPYQPNEFWLHYSRKYSKRDFERSEFLQVFGARSIKWHFRTRNAELAKIPASALRRAKADVLSPHSPTIIIRNTVRELLERSGLSRLIFKPVAPIRGGAYRSDDDVLSWRTVGEPWWELTSDFTLPRLNLGVIELVDSCSFRPFEPDNPLHTLRIHEGLYFVPELHYRRRDIEGMERFDLACTHERQESKGVEPKHVASQRFYQVLKEHGIKARWIPVRLDD